MPRGVDLQNVLRRVKEGRGQGTAYDYKPYIQVKDISSKGLSTRGRGWKTGRVHHFLSQLELKYFYTLEWAVQVTDIREQFPLLDGLDIATLTAAEDLGIKHPTQYNKFQGQVMPIVMTTDLLITANESGRIDDYPRTVKFSEELRNERVIEKLELEREYWAQKGKNLKIVTEHDIDMILAANVELLHKHRDVSGFGNLSRHALESLFRRLLHMCSSHTIH